MHSILDMVRYVLRLLSTNCLMIRRCAVSHCFHLLAMNCVRNSFSFLIVDQLRSLCCRHMKGTLRKWKAPHTMPTIADVVCVLVNNLQYDRGHLQCLKVKNSVLRENQILR